MEPKLVLAYDRLETIGTLFSNTRMLVTEDPALLPPIWSSRTAMRSSGIWRTARPAGRPYLALVDGTGGVARGSWTAALRAAAPMFAPLPGPRARQLRRADPPGRRAWLSEKICWNTLPFLESAVAHNHRSLGLHRRPRTTFSLVTTLIPAADMRVPAWRKI